MPAPATPATTATSTCSAQGATNNLTNFTWNTSICDASGNPAALLPDGLNATEQAHFGTLNVSLLSQYPAMTDGTAPIVDQRTPAEGANLVNYLRGQRGLEGFVTNDVTKLYRAREHVLGDIVNGQPTYVRAPFAVYGDAGYAAFKSANAGRIADALRAGQRRHAACVLRRHQHRRSARRQGSLGGDPEHGAAEALPARRQQLQGQSRLLRRRHAVGQRRVRYRLGKLEDDPRGRPERRRQGLLRARRHRSARAQGPVGVQVELGRLPLVGGHHADRRGGGQHLGLPPRPDLRQAADHQARRRHLGGHGDLGLQQRQRARPSRATAAATSTSSTPPPARSSTRSPTGAGNAGHAERPGPDQRLRRLRRDQQHDAAGLRRRRARQHLALRRQRQHRPRADGKRRCSAPPRTAAARRSRSRSGRSCRARTASRWSSSAPASCSAPATSATCRCSRSTASSIR